MKNIFPKEILENTTEVHQFKHRKKSSIIYSIFLIALIGAFIAPPFIKVNGYSLWNSSEILNRKFKNNKSVFILFNLVR